VITGPGAFATFEMEDASRVTLPSNTAMRVVRLRSVVLTNAPQRVFKLDEGRSAIQATPNPNPNARFEVRTPVSISAVRGTEFRVAASEGRARTEVLKGAVGVGPRRGAARRAPGPGRLRRHGHAGWGRCQRPGRPAARAPLDEAGQNQTDRTVRFAVQPQAGAAGYRLLLSRDAGFVDLFAEATQAGSSADFGPLEDGTYFVRVTALDVAGLEGAPADYSFDRDLDLLEPGAPPIAEVSGKHRRFLFRWSAAGGGVRSFRFQLFAGTEPTAPIVDQPGLVEPQLTLTDLPPGPLQLAGQRHAGEERRGHREGRAAAVAEDRKLGLGRVPPAPPSRLAPLRRLRPAAAIPAPALARWLAVAVLTGLALAGLTASSLTTRLDNILYDRLVRASERPVDPRS
jgi:hypothetical protein